MLPRTAISNLFHFTRFHATSLCLRNHSTSFPVQTVTNITTGRPYSSSSSSSRPHERYNGYKPPRLKPKNRTIYNTFIARVLDEGRLNKALALFREMEYNLLTRPDVATYTLILAHLGRIGRMDKAKKMFNRMLANKLCPDVYVFTTLIDGYMRAGDSDGTERTFRDMAKHKVKPNAVMYNVMIYHSTRLFDMATAIKYFREMISAGIKPDVWSFSMMVNGFAKHKDMDGGWRMHQEMVRQGIDPNTVAVTTLMHMHLKAKDHDGVMTLYEEFFVPKDEGQGEGREQGIARPQE
ncbi:hypothetical protein BC936DRAFT_148506 [Jimgerdemannia flammicorona]|uniref:Pentacotripeptide-repeat region of PRORP domain-containing protein n=1 Tax=Jimgerdemannia flammicorona TaxID=994334 RepID=A0A433D2X8_9FUNG|nr:hypothetical protein BC936DRAFT_148506 [Jimgerdemannia flammicorona]